MNDLRLSISQNFTFIQRGIIVSGSPTLQEWGETWEAIQFFDEDILPYAIGDMLAYGEMSYGQAHAQFLKPSGEGRYSKGTLRNLKYVSSRWPVSRRRYALPWSYYQETAALSEKEQDRIMQEIIDNGGKRNGLRSEVRQLNNGHQQNAIARPDDIIEELRQDNFEKEQQITQLQEKVKTLQQSVIMPEAQAPLTYGGTLPDGSELSEWEQDQIKAMGDVCKNFGWAAITIYEDGRFLVTPRKEE